MLRDILRFNREAPALLDQPDSSQTLDDFLHANEYSREFIEHYIVPMGAAIWSASPHGMGGVPAGFFVRFFHNHGLLRVSNRPTWRVIQGGSHRYVEKLVAAHRSRIRLNTPVQWVRRNDAGVEVKARGAEPERFDRLIMACHSDQALALLADPSQQEMEVLGAIGYQRNEAVLHTDASLMPRKRRAWAAWNYHVPHGREAPGALVQDRPVALTYNMNILQSLDAPQQFCVTLNHTDAIDPAAIIRTIEYTHPIFTERAVAAQQRQREINGPRHTYYCGAYWRYGFHEDGVISAIAALRHLDRDLQHGSLQSALAA
jgi:predicted NAD/FAD-binding protein